MARMNRKTRAVLSGVGVGIASIYAIASHFDLGISTLNSFMLSTLVFFVVIVLLAALALLTIKSLAWLFGSRRNMDEGLARQQPTQVEQTGQQEQDEQQQQKAGQAEGQEETRRRE